MSKYCGTCDHYIGGGDWNLCCDIRHPTKGEHEKGLTFIFGHLCYEDTPACDEYVPKGELEYYFHQLHALEKMLYETDVLDNDIVEVDCLGGKLNENWLY